MNRDSQAGMTPVVSMGRVVNGVAANYDFSIADVLKEGWEKVGGFKGTIWAAIGIYILARILVQVVLGIVKLGIGKGIIFFLLNIIGFFITYPILIGIFMISLKRSVNLPVKATMVLNYYSSFWPIIGVSISMVVLGGLPMFFGVGFLAMSSHSHSLLLFILGLLLFGAGIYLMISYSFVLPLIVEKKLGIWTTLEASRKAVTQHWFKIFFTWVLMTLILIISILPLFIGLIWSYPFVCAVRGIFYRILFGVEEAR